MLPTVVPNPNRAAPLAAIVRFVTDVPVHISIDVSDGTHRWTLGFDDTDDAQNGLPIVGLRPGRRHEFTIAVRGAVRGTSGAVTRAPSVLALTTPRLPDDAAEFPSICVQTSDVAHMEPGVTLLSFTRNRGGDLGFGERYGLIVALDEAGDVVWYYRSDMRLNGFTRLRNGNLVYITHDFRVVEIDWLGNVIAAWYAERRPHGDARGVAVDALTFHHAIVELPSGHLAVLGTQVRRIPDYYTSETDPDAPRTTQPVMGDEIVEFRRSGEVVWRWSAFDDLDPYRIGYETFTLFWHRRGFPGALDWTHGNGLTYDQRDDAFIVSLRYQDAIVKIDRATGDIVWILAEPSDWPRSLADRLLTPDGPVRWPWHQHAPSITPAGTLMVFDNGNYRARPFATPIEREHTYSRAIEYEIDERRKTVRDVWRSEGPGPDSIISVAMGSAERMPATGNVLVVYGVCWPRPGVWRSTRVREWTHTHPARRVWDVILTDSSDPPRVKWSCFFGMRVPHLGSRPPSS